MKVFEDKNMLDKAVEASLLPLISPSKEASKMRSSFPAFRQKIPDSEDSSVPPQISTNDTSSLASETTNNTEIMPQTLHNGPLDLRMLQIGRADNNDETTTVSDLDYTVPSGGTEDNASTKLEDSALEMGSSMEPQSQIDSSGTEIVSSQNSVSLLSQNISELSQLNVSDPSAELLSSMTTKRANGPLVIPVSFLQIASREKAKKRPSGMGISVLQHSL